MSKGGPSSGLLEQPTHSGRGPHHQARQEGEVMNQTMIELQGVHKHYGRIHALNGLDLSVTRGELFGLVGVNGAGKTTTLSLVMGFIQATSGRLNVLGLNPWTDAPALHARVAWLPGDVRLPEALTGREWLEYQSSVARTERTRIPALAQEWEVPINQPMRTLSKGNRQKVALLRLLASDAAMLVLDEPTSGLDPLAQEKLLSVLRERARSGVTVLFSSHSLAEVQTLCDRIAVIDRGRVIKTGTVAALTGGTRTLAVWTHNPIDPRGLEPWKPLMVSSTHAILEGDGLLELALPKLATFGVERAEYGGIGLERLLDQTHNHNSQKVAQ
jgi:ABC-2 type transport system ATP-binding protein